MMPLTIRLPSECCRRSPNTPYPLKRGADFLIFWANRQQLRPWPTRVYQFVRRTDGRKFRSVDDKGNPRSGKGSLEPLKRRFFRDSLVPAKGATDPGRGLAGAQPTPAGTPHSGSPSRGRRYHWPPDPAPIVQKFIAIGFPPPFFQQECCKSNCEFDSGIHSHPCPSTKRRFPSPKWVSVRAR